MQEKVVVTLMKKRKLNDNCSIFTVSAVKTGYYDERFNVFYDDKDGGCYPNIRTIAGHKKDNSLAFDNLIMYSALERKSNDELTEAALRRYEDKCRDHFYAVVTHENKQPIVISLGVNNLEKLAQECRNAKNVEVELGGRVKKVESTDFNFPCVKDGTMDFDQALASVYDMIAAGGRSKEELTVLKDELTYYRNVIGNVLGLINFEMNDKNMKVDKEVETEETVTCDKKNTTSVGHDEDILEDTLKKEKSSGVVDIEEIVSKIRKKVVHQDEPIHRLVLEIERNLTTTYEKDGILITGSTGVGKTATVNLIAKYLDRPVKIIDTTQLTVPGYVGKDVEDYLYELLYECGGDVEKAEGAIIFFDEIDKKGSEKKSDISGQGVLNVLLKFLDGTVYNVCPDRRKSGKTIKISTKNMVVLAGGSFADVYRRSESRQIGFGVENESEYVPTVNDFVENGMMTKDFMGRFPIVIHYNDLDAKALADILVNSSVSPLKREEEVFSKAGVKLTVTPEWIEAIASEAAQMETGARGLKGLVRNVTCPSYAKVKAEPNEYREVILNEDTVSDNKKYVLVKKDNQ